MTSDSDIPDSPLTTPPILTPESTGSPDTAGIGKSRRQTAFYPNVNSTNKTQKPFSRSAAKRESVMALGSIEHLQHYFTKTGIAAKKHPSGKSYSGVPAIGGKTHVKSNPSLSPLPELELPPSPAIPPPPAFPPFLKTYETNPESLLPGVVHDLAAVAEAWRISDDNFTFHNPELLGANRSPRSTFDVLATLKSTTRAIRSVRNYVLSLPDESAGTLRAQFRSRSLAASTPVPKRLISHTNAPTDPLSLIRRSALEVLTSLRELEESSRVPLADDAYDAQSDRGSSQSQSSHSRVGSPISNVDETLSEVDPDSSISYSLVQVHGRYESIPVWEDDESFDMSEEEQEKRERWDERLALGGGWLYKQDIRLKNLGPEQEVVQRYLDVVDMVLFGGARDGKRGWEREREKAERRERAEKEGKAKSRRVSSIEESPLQSSDAGRQARRIASTGMLDMMKNISLSEEPEDIETLSGEESVDDDELPTWAKRTSFADDELGRAHAILTTFLPESLRPLLPPSTNRTTFLQTLSSGQLLCVAYNACVRRSRKPWGYVIKDAIHDIFALEQAADEQIKRGWTFRRTDNLRLWAGALKIRYLLPVVTTESQKQASSNNTPVASSPSTIRSSASETPIFFDASAVARRDPGWESMLETLLLRWAVAVVGERRGDR